MMDINKIKEITFGAVDYFVEDDYLAFSRFFESERNTYKDEPDMVRKTKSTAGIKMDFITDGDELSFDYRLIKSSSRQMAFFDVYINGAFVESVGRNGASEFYDAKYDRELPKGEKRITVYFPNLYALRIKNFDISNFKILKPFEYDMSMVFYGDSITQGYDAMMPSYSYANRTATQLNAYLYNKAIGGDMFRPDLARACESPNVDAVIIAYGTNDWSHKPKDEVTKNASIFFEYIENKYKNSKVFVLTPIWRNDFEKQVKFGKFSEMRDYLTSEAAKHKSFTVVDGDTLLPHSAFLFSDGFLHPNDIGMNIYSENLSRVLKQKMNKM